ncbi:cold-shock protein [Hahella sp. SMD15-11]|uniref:Cold-shock protein n=1 Tax=Thermohahella caldifontis TaxID=3142973 RepID=A0AB39V0A4_9GAMM
MSTSFAKTVAVSAVCTAPVPLIAGVLIHLVAGVPQFDATAQEASWHDALSGARGIGLYLAVWLAAFVAALVAARMVTAVPSAGRSRQSDMDQPATMDENDDREEGTVKWFNANKGFGFITRGSGEDIFVHFRAIRGRGHRVLKQGQVVRFRVTESEKGLQADDVSVIRES